MRSGSGRTRRRARALGAMMACAAVGAWLMVPAAADAADPLPTYVRDFAGPGLADMYPVDVAANGTNFYVVDPGRYRVVKIDRATGAMVAQFGGHQGKSATRIGAARGLAVDPDGNVYVADTANNRVVKLDADLHYVTAWGTRGTGNGQFTANYGIAVGPGIGLGGAPAEVVYVTDGTPGRVQKFALDGTYISTFGAGSLNKARQVAVDPTSHNVYVVSATPKQVVVFNENGVKLSQFGGVGTGPGQFKQDPRGISITSAGQVFVSDPGNGRVQVWSTSNVYQCSFGSKGTSPGQFVDIRGLAATADGRIAVTDEWDFGVHEFSFSGSACPAIAFQRDLFGAPPPVGGFDSPRGMDVDALGRVFVTDWWNQRVQSFNGDGSGASAWGFRGIRTVAGAMNFAWDLAVQQSTNRIFVANRESHEIEVFSSTGTFLADWGKYGAALGQFKFPQGVAFASNGDLLVADSGNNRIQRCSVDANGEGTCYTSYGGAGSNPGQFKVPTEIAVASDGSIWVADTQNNRVQVRSPNGTWSAVGTPTGGTKFKLPWGVAVAPDGSIWVADSGNERIVQMTSGGAQLLAFTGTDVGAGAFDNPFDVAFLANGHVLVSDTWNNRIVELQP